MEMAVNPNVKLSNDDMEQRILTDVVVAVKVPEKVAQELNAPSVVGNVSVTPPSSISQVKSAVVPPATGV